MAFPSLMADMTQISGAQTFGPYQLHELVNQGGAAEIWLASDSDRNTLAIRRALTTSMLDFTAKKRFLRGCEILAEVQDHELIPAHYDHGKIQGRLFMAMEYIEGDNLKLLSHRGDPIVQESLANILIDSATALDHVHTCGYMHLDFKPENIIVTRNGHVRLTDFDLSAPIPETPQRVKKIGGTPFYMAPEQLLKKPFDHRADIFAFGVMAYELVTEQKPFQGETPEQTLLAQINRKAFRAPIDRNPALPPALNAIILRCLEINPEDRYPFMSIVVHELEKSLYIG